MEAQEKTGIDYENMTIGKIVAKDYRKAMVFKAHGIDFCCGGGISLLQAANEHKVSLDQLLAELKKIDAIEELDVNYNEWETEKLINHIVDKHHVYVANTIEQLSPLLNKVEMVHGGWRPELVEVNRLFREVANELIPHMHKEERILFPAILEMANGNISAGQRFGSVQNPINMMEHEHDIAGDLMRKIAELTDDYTLPKGACATYTVVYKVLNEFEQDLHTHIHLENNILFPRAIEMEQNAGL